MADLLLLAVVAAFFVGLGLSTRVADASLPTAPTAPTVPAGRREATTLTTALVWAALLQGIRIFSRLHDRRRANRAPGWAAD